MTDTIQTTQTGRQIDNNLLAICNVLEAATDQEGKVLFIRHGQISFEDGESLFDIVSSE